MFLLLRHFRMRSVIAVALLLASFSAATPVLAATKPVMPTIGKPRVLLIPKIRVKAVIEARGTDAKGLMQTPVVAKNVAWYSEGARPGEKGNAVMSGHLDWAGGPSVFWRLRNLHVGDYVLVQDEKGQAFRFRVVKKAVYPRTSAPLNEILGATNRKRLNLVTCAGTYSRAARNYSHRLVVFTELVP